MNTEQIESNPWEKIISSAMKKVQIEFESVCFMHEQQEEPICEYGAFNGNQCCDRTTCHICKKSKNTQDYMDIYAEYPKGVKS